MNTAISTNVGWADAVNQEKIRWINKYIEFGKEKSILELGSGAGWYSKYLADNGCQVTSLDMEPLFKDARINLKVANLENKLDFDDKSFDYVVAWDIIEHVGNEKQLLEEIKRVSKPGAKCLISVPNMDDSRIAGSYLTFCHFKDKTHKREYTPNILSENLKKINCTSIDIQLHGGNGYPYIILNFIDNIAVKLLMRILVKGLILLGFIKVKNCHGDIFGVFEI
jgi:2-polyprenyl-3-methyl-5-hydroxy-6-metoxy-1,4-benzoquinol methylase